MEKAKKSERMSVVNPHAVGVDIGSKSHWVAIGQKKEDVKEFGSYTVNLDEICIWLKENKITTVAMESTGNYWKALYVLLQGKGFEVLLVNGRFTKNVKGKKTDMLDCQWIQKLHTLGMLEGSFIPDNDTEKLKQFCRHRQSLLEDGASYIRKMQKALRQTNIRLDNALNDVTGLSGRTIIEAILNGHRSPTYLASLVHPGVRTPPEEMIQALTGDWRDEYIFELKQSYEIYKFFHQNIAACDKEIEKILQERIQQDESLSQNNISPLKIKQKRYNKNDPKINLQLLSYQLTGGIDLSAIDGVSHNTLLSILSEVGLNFSKFPTARHFASWLRLAPNNKKSGGKILSSRTPKGNSRLANAFRHVAVVVGHNLKRGVLHHFFMRIAFRKGKLAAITATARKIAVIIWHMMTKKTSYNYMKEEDYLMGIRLKQVKSIKRKIKTLNIQPHELGVELSC